MLKRVKIQGYKSLVDVEVELQPLTVLFGPNAAGKSNFLDALQLISRLATSKKLSDAFEPPYRGTVLESFTFGPQGIEGLLKQEKVSFSLEVDIEFSKKTLETAKQYFHNIKNTAVADIDLANVQFVRFFIEIETNPKSGIIQTSQQTIKVFDSTKTEIDRIPESKIRSGLRSTFLRYYDDIHRYSTPPAYFIALFEELTNWRFFYLEPRERMRQPAPVREARHIGAMGEDIAPFLNTLRALDEAQFKALEKALHLLIPEITGIDVDVNNRGDVEVRLMQGPTPLPASVLSEGTWRMLGLLALGGAKETPALLGFEEPENGINPQRLDLIASLLTNLTYNDTQVIVTTHSPTLLDALPQESLYVVQQRDGKTSIDPLARFDKSSLPAANRLISERLLRGDFNV